MSLEVASDCQGEVVTIRVCIIVTDGSYVFSRLFSMCMLLFSRIYLDIRLNIHTHMHTL